MNLKQITFSRHILIVNNGYTATPINEYVRNGKNVLKGFLKKEIKRRKCFKVST
jgi:hypothetical protein